MKDKDIIPVVDAAFNTAKPNQIYGEILELSKYVAELKAKYVLEIGTERGGTLFLWTRLSRKDAVIISIDLPGGRFGGGYPESKIPLYKSFARNKQKLHLIRKDSHIPAVLDETKKILSGHELDFLFIDGDHTYEGVKKDFEVYSPLVRKNGMISFHDIVPGPFQNVGGVPKFWNEVKKDYKHFEIVKNANQRGYGIGVIYV